MNSFLKALFGLYPHVFGSMSKYMRPVQYTQNRQKINEIELSPYQRYSEALNQRKEYPDLAIMQQKGKFDKRFLRTRDDPIHTQDFFDRQYATNPETTDAINKSEIAILDRELDHKLNRNKLKEYLGNKEKVLEPSMGMPTERMPVEEYDDAMFKTGSREKILKKIKSNYKNKMLNPARNEPIRFYQNIDNLDSMENYVPPEHTSSMDIYKELEDSIFPRYNYEKFIDSHQKLQRIKNLELNVLPNAKEIFSELRKTEPVLYEQLKRHIAEKDAASVEDYVQYLSPKDRERALTEFKNGRDYIFPQDIEAMNWPPEVFENLPYLRQSMRKMGYSKNMVHPLDVINETITNNKQFLHEVESLAPEMLKDITKYGTSFVDNILDASSDFLKRLDWSAPEGKAVFEKFYGTEDVPTKALRKQRIQENYENLEKVLRGLASDSENLPEIERLLKTNKKMAINAFLNETELFLENPNLAMDKYLEEDRFKFERSAFKEMYPELDEITQQQIGDVYNELSSMELEPDYDALHEKIRQYPEMFKIKMAELFPNNHLRNLTNEELVTFLNDRTMPEHMNKAHWRKPTLRHNQENPNIIDFIPENVNEHNFSVSEINNYMNEAGMFGVADVFNEMERPESFSYDDFKSAVSENPSDYQTAIQENPSEYQTVISENPSEYQNLDGESQISVRNALSNEINRTPSGFINPRLNKFFGSALKGLGKINDVLTFLDATDIAAKDAVTYKDAIADKGFIKGSLNGLANTFGRGLDYAINMYNNAKEQSLFSSFNEKVFPNIPYYESEYVHPEVEQREQGFVEGIGNKIQNIGSNIQYVAGVDNAQPSTHIADSPEMQDLDFTGTNSWVGHPMFSDEMGIKPMLSSATSTLPDSNKALPESNVATQKPSPDVVHQDSKTQEFIGNL